MIKIENLSKKFGVKKVLNSINLNFEKGTIYGVVGENGAGKTTLFMCISGLEAYSGKISSDFISLKSKLGLLLTEPFFFSKITGKEYLQLLTNARQVELLNVQDKNIFDLPLNQYTSTYSSGMKKKLALTAVLLQQNEIFILNEPFNGVDIQSNLVIIEIIKKLKALGKMIIKKVPKENFADLANEIREFTIGNRIEKLGLI